MKQQQLIPKHRRKRQPSADQLREQLRLAADEIIRLRLKADRDRKRVHSPMGAVARALLIGRDVGARPVPWYRDPDAASYTGRIVYVEDPPGPLRRLWHRIAARLRKDAP